ncbi:hypothetical protein Dsin_008625 [Dipteronia sinensis]|uniref:RNase H type-1 domain-containing protein n=1 Tax=Dipteronia sinensis TaxID=43782 RepID=A0AAE0APR5_9ROSI|nr:hypothetical protein Dsin_008625 [Dipteronia sinensis]
MVEFQKANEMRVGSNGAAASTVIRWRPPTANVYKLNTDAALDVGRGIVGVGAIIRNHQGHVMGSTSQRLEATFSPKEAEAMAILRGIEFAVGSGLMPVVIESDSLGVVNLINLGAPNLMEIGLICKDVEIRICEGGVTFGL